MAQSDILRHGRGRRPALGLVLAMGLAFELAACGGSAGDPAADLVAEPLFAGDGRPNAAALAEPPEPAEARTRAGLYVSTERYEWEALTSSPYTVLVDVPSPAAETAAIDDAMAAFAWPSTTAPVAFFVRSADAAAGARVADTLTARGIPHVFLLVDGGGRGG